MERRLTVGRGAALAATALTLIGVLAGSARAERHPPRYKLILIEPFGGADSHANGINDDRVVVGAARDANGLNQPFRYHRGRMTQLPTLPGAIGGAALAINEDGAICGSSRLTSSVEPTLWLRSQASDLGAAPGDFPFGECLGIASDDGLAAGTAFDETGNFARLLGFRRGDVLDISLAANPFNTMFNMNRHGVISAFASAVNPVTLIFQSIGFTVDLRREKTTAFSALDGDTQTVINVVTSHGTVYGFSFNDVTQSVVAFDPRGNGMGAILRTEPLGAGSVVANDRLVVETYGGTQNPIIYVHGEWLDLPSLITNLGDFVLGDAIQMNELGDIVGSGFLPTGAQRGFILERQDDRD